MWKAHLRSEVQVGRANMLRKWYSLCRSPLNGAQVAAAAAGGAAAPPSLRRGPGSACASARCRGPKPAATRPPSVRAAMATSWSRRRKTPIQVPAHAALSLRLWSNHRWWVPRAPTAPAMCARRMGAAGGRNDQQAACSGGEDCEESRSHSSGSNRDGGGGAGGGRRARPLAGQGGAGEARCEAGEAGRAGASAEGGSDPASPGVC